MSRFLDVSVVFLSQSSSCLSRLHVLDVLLSVVFLSLSSSCLLVSRLSRLPPYNLEPCMMNSQLFLTNSNTSLIVRTISTFWVQGSNFQLITHLVTISIRFAKNAQITFYHLYKCSEEEKSKVAVLLLLVSTTCLDFWGSGVSVICHETDFLNPKRPTEQKYGLGFFDSLSNQESHLPNHIPAP